MCYIVTEGNRRVAAQASGRCGAERERTVADDQGEPTESISVTYQVDHVETVKNAGRLVALAIVTITVEGVEFRIQGVRVMRQPTGLLAVEAPRFRSPAGEWLPAVTLPDALKGAIADEILAVVEDRRG